MKILVTGGSGFIGSRVVDQLVRAGHEVRVLDLKNPDRADVEFMEGTITSRDDVADAVHGIEAVYHLAAFSNVDMVKANPLTTVDYNIMGTARVLDECRLQNTGRFILASSVYVNDEKGHLYTTCKMASEMLCRNYNTLYELPYTILRYGTAYGPGSRDADVISVFVQRALEGNRLIIRGSGTQKRHFIYVDDLAEGSLAALTPRAVNRTYTLVGPDAVTIRKLTEVVRNTVSGNVQIEFQPSREDDHLGKLPGISAAMQAAKQDLNWTPKTDVSSGIRMYLDWYRQHRNVSVLHR